jgi:large subunit ribosomal protein L29
MKASELRSLSTEELVKKNRDAEQELFNLKFQLHTGRLENTAKMRFIRKQIARVNTILSEKQS